MQIKRIPRLTRPRFVLANRAAQSVLKELGNPEPPIPIKKYIDSKGWEVVYTNMAGMSDGMLVKMSDRKTVFFRIYIATDVPEDSPYELDTVEKRRTFTLAHELGHILLHNSFGLDGTNFTQLPEDIQSILEVEAHWFASRLLMPNYVFKDITDLLPEKLAKKCEVNITPAIKRLGSLSSDIRNSLIETVRLDKWPSSYLEDLEDFLPPIVAEHYSQSWESLAQARSSSSLLYICPDCGLLHNETLLLMGRRCHDCDQQLVNLNGLVC